MTSHAAYSAAFLAAFVAKRRELRLKSHTLHILGLWISIGMGWHCPRLFELLTRRPTAEETKLLEDIKADTIKAQKSRMQQELQILSAKRKEKFIAFAKNMLTGIEAN